MKKFSHGTELCQTPLKLTVSQPLSLLTDFYDNHFDRQYSCMLFLPMLHEINCVFLLLILCFTEQTRIHDKISDAFDNYWD